MESRADKTSNVDEQGPPASASTVNIKRDDGNLRPRTNSLLDNHEDGNDRNSGKSLPDRVVLKSRNASIKIETWNVRSMYQK